MNLIHNDRVTKNVPHVGGKKKFFPDLISNKTNDKSYSIDFIIGQKQQYQYQQLQQTHKRKYLLFHIQQDFDRLKNKKTWLTWGTKKVTYFSYQ